MFFPKPTHLLLLLTLTSLPPTPSSWTRPLAAAGVLAQRDTKPQTPSNISSIAAGGQHHHGRHRRQHDDWRSRDYGSGGDGDNSNKGDSHNTDVNDDVSGNNGNNGDNGGKGNTDSTMGHSNNGNADNDSSPKPPARRSAINRRNPRRHHRRRLSPPNEDEDPFGPAGVFKAKRRRRDMLDAMGGYYGGVEERGYDDDGDGDGDGDGDNGDGDDGDGYEQWGDGGDTEGDEEGEVVQRRDMLDAMGGYYGGWDREKGKRDRGYGSYDGGGEGEWAVGKDIEEDEEGGEWEIGEQGKKNLWRTGETDWQAGEAGGVEHGSQYYADDEEEEMWNLVAGTHEVEAEGLTKEETVMDKAVLVEDITMVGDAVQGVSIEARGKVEAAGKEGCMDEVVMFYIVAGEDDNDDMGCDHEDEEEKSMDLGVEWRDGVGWVDVDGGGEEDTGDAPAPVGVDQQDGEKEGKKQETMAGDDDGEEEEDCCECDDQGCCLDSDSEDKPDVPLVQVKGAAVETELEVQTETKTVIMNPSISPVTQTAVVAPEGRVHGAAEENADEDENAADTTIVTHNTTAPTHTVIVAAPLGAGEVGGAAVDFQDWNNGDAVVVVTMPVARVTRTVQSQAHEEEAAQQHHYEVKGAGIDQDDENYGEKPEIVIITRPASHTIDIAISKAGSKVSKTTTSSKQSHGHYQYHAAKQQDVMQEDGGNEEEEEEGEVHGAEVSLSTISTRRIVETIVVTRPVSSITVMVASTTKTVAGGKNSITSRSSSIRSSRSGSSSGSSGRSSTGSSRKSSGSSSRSSSISRSSRTGSSGNSGNSGSTVSSGSISGAGRRTSTRTATTSYGIRSSYTGTNDISIRTETRSPSSRTSTTASRSSTSTRSSTYTPRSSTTSITSSSSSPGNSETGSWRSKITNTPGAPTTTSSGVYATGEYEDDGDLTTTITHRMTNTMTKTVDE